MILGTLGDLVASQGVQVGAQGWILVIWAPNWGPFGSYLGACFGYLGVLILAVLQGLNFKGICEQMGSFWLHFGDHFGVTFAVVWRCVDLVIFSTPLTRKPCFWWSRGDVFRVFWHCFLGSVSGLQF